MKDKTTADRPTRHNRVNHAAAFADCKTGPATPSALSSA